MRSLIAFLSSFLLFGVAHAARVVASDTTRPVLGQGYDSQTGKLRQICVTGDLAYVGAGESELQLAQGQTLETMKSDVEATLGASVDILVASASAESTLQNYFVSTALMNRYFSRARVVGKQVRLVNIRLTPFGEDVFDSGDEQTIRAQCGDGFVTTVTLGVYFSYSLNLQSYNSHSATRLRTVFSIELPFKTLRKERSKSWKVDRKHTDVTFEAVQFGGNLKAFEAYQKKLEERGCDADELADCFAIADAAFDYVASPEGLRAQLGDLSYNQSEPTSSPILFADTARYPSTNGNLFLSDTIDPLPYGYAHGRGRNARLLESAKRILAHPRLPESLRPALDDTHSRLQFNEAIFKRVGFDCQRGVDACVASWKRRQPELMPYDETSVMLPLRFADYCNNSDERPEIAHTTGAVRATFGNASCEEAEALLEGARVVSLRSAQLSNLLPLAWLPNAIKIDLAHNDIATIQKVNWNGVRSLNLAHNSLSDLAFLALVPNVRELRLSYNSIQHARTQHPLALLSLYGNPILRLDVPTGPVLRREEDACAFELNQLTENGELAKEIADSYLKRGFGPEFEWQNGERSSSGMFLTCSKAALFFE